MKKKPSANAGYGGERGHDGIKQVGDFGGRTRQGTRNDVIIGGNKIRSRNNVAGKVQSPAIPQPESTKRRYNKSLRTQRVGVSPLEDCCTKHVYLDGEQIK